VRGTAKDVGQREINFWSNFETINDWADQANP
jgi:hypothetical protein